MNYQAFQALIKQGKIASCYLLEGEEEYIKQQMLALLAGKILSPGMEAMNRTDLTNPPADAIISAAETLPFMSERRLVVVRECPYLALSKKGGGEETAEAEEDEKGGKTKKAAKDPDLDSLLNYLPTLPAETCLIFYQKGKADSRKKLYTTLKKMNAIVTIERMTDADCAGWLVKKLKKLGKTMDYATANHMVFTVGTDAALLNQEIEKLAASVADREVITKEDIEAICTHSVESNVFNMIDAQVAGHTGKALALLRDMQQLGESPFMVLSLLLRQYRILYHLRRLESEGVEQNKLAELTGIAPYFLSRSRQQANAFSLEKLREAYDYLVENEFLLKQGRLPQQGCAENAMLRLEEILRGQEA